MDCKTNTCYHTEKKSKSELISFWSWILIVILPKCPLCILSFSSAVSLCGGKTIFEKTVGWTSYIPIILAAIVITSFIINYKGTKTLTAITIALVSCAIILYGEYITKTEMTYYLGVAALFFACWINGSFHYFIRKMKSVSTRLSA